MFSECVKVCVILTPKRFSSTISIPIPPNSWFSQLDVQHSRRGRSSQKTKSHIQTLSFSFTRAHTHLCYSLKHTHTHTYTHTSLLHIHTSLFYTHTRMTIALWKPYFVFLSSLVWILPNTCVWRLCASFFDCCE